MRGARWQSPAAGTSVSMGERDTVMDQQPQYQPQTTVSGSTHGMSSLIGSLGSDIMAGLTYLVSILFGVGLVLQIVVFAVEKNRFVKFHAAQAMILSIVAIALFIVDIIINTIFTVGASAVDASGSGLGALGAFGVSAVTSCVLGIIGLVLFAFWIWGMFAAFTGKATKLPIIGGFAEGLAGGPLV